MTSGQQVANNDLILENIAPYINHPADRVRARLVSRKFDKAMMDYQNKNKTLKITTLRESKDNHIEVRFRHITWFLDNKGLVKEELDRIVEDLPTNSLQLIRTIIVKGYGYNRIKIDEDFGYFLNRFLNLKHLEFESVSLKYRFFRKLPEYSFIDKIENLHLMNLSLDCHDKLKNLVTGKHLENLYMTEKMLRNEKDLLDWFDNTSVFVAILLDEKDWQSEIMPILMPFYWSETLDPEWYINQINKCHLVPYFQRFTRNIHLDQEKIPRLKHCENLTELGLQKLKEGGNDTEIGRLISEIQHLKKLKKLTIDGHFKKTHLRRLMASICPKLSQMEDCPKLSELSLRMRPGTTNTDEWIWVLRTIPKHIPYIKLDNIVSDEAIIALNTQKSDSLETLHWIIRENEPSSEAVRMVTEDLGMFTSLSVIKMEDGKGVKEMRRGHDFRIEENGGSRKRKLEVNTWVEIVGRVGEDDGEDEDI